MSKSPELGYPGSEKSKEEIDDKIDIKPVGIERMQEQEAVKAMLEILNNAAFSPFYSKEVEKVADAIVELGTAIKKRDEQAGLLTEQDFE